MRIASRVICVICTMGCVVCTAPVAASGQTNRRAEARRHHELGLSLVKGRSFGEAIAEFNQSFDLGHDSAVLYDVGKAYIAIDQPVFAIDALKKYLVLGGKRIPPSRRHAVLAEIRAQESQVATITVRAEIPGTVLRVDGIERGRPPFTEEIRVNAGPHVFAATATGYRPWEHRLELAGAEHAVLDIHLEPEQSEPVAPPAQAKPIAVPASTPAPAIPAPAIEPPVTDAPTGVTTATAPPSTAGSKKVGIVLGGLGIAALAVGGVYGVRAILQRHDSDKLCPQNQCSEAGVEKNNQAKTAARIADVTIGAGLVSVAVATYLLLRSPKSTTDDPAPSAPDTRLSAVLGPGEAHVVLGGSW